MPNAYENIRKLNFLLHTGAPLTEQKRLELAALRKRIEAQIIHAETPRNSLAQAIGPKSARPQPA
jgi:hypothetical protein